MTCKAWLAGGVWENAAQEMFGFIHCLRLSFCSEIYHPSLVPRPHPEVGSGHETIIILKKVISITWLSKLHVTQLYNTISCNKTYGQDTRLHQIHSHTLRSVSSSPGQTG